MENESPQLEPPSNGKSSDAPSWGIAGEIGKYTAVIAIFGLSIFFLRKKLKDITWEQMWDGISSIPSDQIALAVLFTAINFVVLTGYDLIAVRYLKKDLPLPKVMVGAIIGYALSNILGWMIGGTAIRYRLYTSWGFRLIEVIALVSILSVTFWLGMFMLAGVAFVCFEVKLPEQYADMLHMSPVYWGYLFLFVVLIYLGATLFIRKPIHVGNQEFRFPPFKLSLLQLAVSASDFALASLVLFVLLPSGSVEYPTVMVSYLAAMIVVVVLHVPGGFGVLEVVILELLAKEEDGSSPLKIAVTAGLIAFRGIYYFAPGIFASVLLALHEWKHAKKKRMS